MSGIEAFPLALVIWGIAAFWALLAVLTWEPLTRRLAYAWRGHEGDPPQPPVDPRSELKSRLRDFRDRGQQLYDSEPMEVYGWSQALRDLIEDALGQDAATEIFQEDREPPDETSHEHLNRVLRIVYGLLGDIDSLTIRHDWNP